MAGRSAEKSEFRWYHGLVFALSVELGAFFYAQTGAGNDSYKVICRLTTQEDLEICCTRLFVLGTSQISPDLT